MRRITLYFTFIAFVTLQASMVFGKSVKPLPDGMPTYHEFETKIKQYPYVATSERTAKILTGLQKVKKCMDKTSIKALLGLPDYSRLEYGPKGPGEHWLGSSWTYYLSMRSSGVNIYDHCIEIFFDTESHATWIVPSNIKGAHETGSAGDKCP